MNFENMDRLIICKSNLCPGCGFCEIECELNEAGIKKKPQTVIRIPLLKELSEQDKRRIMLKDLTLCPQHAIDFDENGDIVTLDNKCNGCGHCINQLECGAFEDVSEDFYVYLCHMCKGKTPQCVSLCPHNALKVVDIAPKDQLIQFYIYPYHYFLVNQ